MSASTLNVGWNTQTDVQTLPWPGPAAPARRVSRQIGAGPVRCPGCDSIVYSRRHRLCGVCSQPLPEELLFTVAEAHRVEAVLQAERTRHKKWLEQRGTSV